MLMLMVGIAFSLSAQDASFYRKYADKGDKEAMYNLADCYLKGTGGVQQDFYTAVEWLTKAAKKNYAPAQVALAYCYISGSGVLKDYKRAWDLAEKASKQANGEGHYLVASMYKMGIHVQKDLSQWQKYLKSAAYAGCAEAQAEMGVAYLNGVPEANITQDSKLAISLLSQASQQGNTTGNFYLGICYENGVGVNKDETKAINYYYTAANAGHAVAQSTVGWAYLWGMYGLDVNYSEAYKYVNAAIEQGEPQAYKIMGDIYRYGLGITEDNYTAVEWYRKASEAGNIPATNLLAEMYIWGLGVVQDKTKGYHLYKAAADADDLNGFAGLGLCYENGYGVIKNMHNAVTYYKKAAERGQNYSRYRLYKIYREGEGVTKNNQEALKYLRMAADDNYADALCDLGIEYHDGEILHSEPATAIKYFTRAADNGSYFACGVLGIKYYLGEDPLDKDYDKAFLYLSAAVDEMSSMDDKMQADVYKYLASCYRFGRGTAVNHGLASYYTEKAAELGETGAYDAVKMLRPN